MYKKNKLKIRKLLNFRDYSLAPRFCIPIYDIYKKNYQEFKLMNLWKNLLINVKKTYVNKIVIILYFRLNVQTVL